MKTEGKEVSGGGFRNTGRRMEPNAAGAFNHEAVMLAKSRAPCFRAAIVLLMAGVVTAPFGGVVFERFYPGTVSDLLKDFWIRDLLVHQYALWAGLSLTATAISRVRREPARGRLLLVVVTLLVSLLCWVVAELLWGPWV